jgi:DNA polymerase III delta prime subunit
MIREMWVEKYRPKVIGDVIGQENIVAEMRNIIEGKAPMQHFLFFSPEPGTGKTTIARVMAEALGYQMHEFNASSKKQRGIEFIEDQVLPLSRIGQWETLFLLDEADRVTPQAQDALKGVIENACGYFILTCNDLNRVSPWLKSRCQVRTFEPVGEDEVMARLYQICAAESVDVTRDQLNIIVKHHKGDMRNSIACLQSASYMDKLERTQFLLGLSEPDLDAVAYLKKCFKHADIDGAVAMMKGDVKTSIDAIFDAAVDSAGGTPESKMRVIEAAIVSRRDLINGVPAEYVRHNFARMLIEGHGQS